MGTHGAATEIDGAFATGRRPLPPPGTGARLQLVCSTWATRFSIKATTQAPGSSLTRHFRSFKRSGAQRSIRSTLERIGNALYSEGKMQEAQTYYQQALRLDQEVDNPGMLASDYGNLANTLAALGDLEGALKMQQKALAAFNSIGSRRGTASVLDNLGDLYLEMGNPEQAKGYYQKALALHRETGYRVGEKHASSGLGEVMLAEGTWQVHANGTGRAHSF